VGVGKALGVEDGGAGRGQFGDSVEELLGLPGPLVVEPGDRLRDKTVEFGLAAGGAVLSLVVRDQVEVGECRLDEPVGEAGQISGRHRRSATAAGEEVVEGKGRHAIDYTKCREVTPGVHLIGR